MRQVVSVTYVHLRRQLVEAGGNEWARFEAELLRPPPGVVAGNYRLPTSNTQELDRLMPTIGPA